MKGTRETRERRERTGEARERRAGRECVSCSVPCSVSCSAVCLAVQCALQLINLTSCHRTRSMLMKNVIVMTTYPRRAGQIRKHSRAARPCIIYRRVGIQSYQMGS